MAAPSPDKPQPLPTLAELSFLGMYEIQTRASDLSPKETNRGLQRNMKAREWVTTITSFSAERPVVKATRTTPEEAERDAKLRFVAIFKKGQKLPAVMDNPEAKATPKPPARAVTGPADVDLDDLV